MEIRLHMQPKTAPVSWESFIRDYPQYSIALDGFVFGGPKFDAESNKVNFNHHEDVSRLETRATCAQVLMGIRQGLFDRFKGAGKIEVYANDCDQDVCTSWFLINNYHLALNSMNPLINRLVFMEDMLDSTAGAYPFSACLPTLEHFAWVFEPYTAFRLSGGLSSRDETLFKNVVFDVEHRILDHTMGKGKTLPLDIRYQVISRTPTYALVEEIGAQARTGMFSDGIKAFVSFRKNNDSYTYILGKMSAYINFDIQKIIEKLNQIENCESDCWGGSETIAGSPRIRGSQLSPDDLVNILKDNFGY